MCYWKEEISYTFIYNNFDFLFKPVYKQNNSKITILQATIIIQNEFKNQNNSTISDIYTTYICKNLKARAENDLVDYKTEITEQYISLLNHRILEKYD